MPPVSQFQGVRQYVPVGLFFDSAGERKKQYRVQHNEGTVIMSLESVLSGGSLTSSHIEVSSANSLSILIGSKAFVGVCLVLVYIDNLSK